MVSAVLPLLALLGFALQTVAGPVQTLLTRADAITQPDVGQFILDPTFSITAAPQVREYYLVIKQGPASPDGVSKQVYTYNGTMPGPVIEANTGDTLRITIENQSDRNHLTHFHGIPQAGSNWADGES